MHLRIDDQRRQDGRSQSPDRGMTLGAARIEAFLLVQRVQLGSPARKAFLFALAMAPVAVGPRPVRWRYRDLASAIDLGLKSVYRIALCLERMGLIVRKPIPGGGVWIAICWSQLSQRAEQQSFSAAIVDRMSVGGTSQRNWSGV